MDKKIVYKAKNLATEQIETHEILLREFATDGGEIRESVGWMRKQCKYFNLKLLSYEVVEISNYKKA